MRGFRCLICLAQIGGVEASMNPLCDANENSGMIVYLTLQHGCNADVRLASDQYGLFTILLLGSRIFRVGVARDE